MSNQTTYFGAGAIVTLIIVPLAILAFGQVGLWASHVPQLQENTERINSNVIKLTKSNDKFKEKLIETISILTGKSALHEHRLSEVEKETISCKDSLEKCKDMHRTQ